MASHLLPVCLTHLACLWFLVEILVKVSLLPSVKRTQVGKDLQLRLPEIKGWIVTHPAPPQAPSPRHGPQQLWHIWVQKSTAVSSSLLSKLSGSCQQGRKRISCLKAAWITPPNWRALNLIKSSWCLRDMLQDHHEQWFPLQSKKNRNCTMLTEHELRDSDLGTGGCHSSFQVVSGTPLFADHSTPSHYIMQVFSTKLTPPHPSFKMMEE